MTKLSVGNYFGVGKNRKKILDIIRLGNGWLLLKTENSKSSRDFKVRAVYQTEPRIRSYTPKHAHFAIDFYGKMCANRERALELLQAIIWLWTGKMPVEKIIQQYSEGLSGLPGYDLEYILHALKWILEQEDINFKGRPPKKQAALDEILGRFNVTTPEGRLGSQLAISLFCDIALGNHPVEALIRANLDILPAKRGRGAV